MNVIDARFWYQFMNDHAVNKFLPDRIKSESEMAGILQWLATNYELDIQQAIRITLSISQSNQPEQPLGWVTYGPLTENERLKEIGFAILPQHWGKGLATEASRGLLNWINENDSVSRVFATVDHLNSASIRVLEKLGMKRIDEREIGMKPGKGHDIYMMELHKQRREN